ncbi:BON domain-containing protein [Actinoplanes sp. NPDC026619]|uniref:BON domain-containing protein n=1 Tax=Actinoplanes sp. NPDC026619 TaxID=3155798 RepID=UPI0033CCCC17
MFWNYPEEWFGSGWSPGSDAGTSNLGTDEWIADRTVMALCRDPAVRGRRFEVLVQNRVIILNGDVGSTQARTAAGRRAWSVPGVFDVANCLTVRGGMAGLEDGPR